jgi:predicted secreted protein
MARVELTASTSGETVRVRPDDEIVLRLHESPTTGFRWEVEDLGPGLVELDDAFTLDEPELIGGGGLRQWRFRVADALGRARIALRHWQPWEGEASISDRFTVDVEVER